MISDPDPPFRKPNRHESFWDVSNVSIHVGTSSYMRRLQTVASSMRWKCMTPFSWPSIQFIHSQSTTAVRQICNSSVRATFSVFLLYITAAWRFNERMKLWLPIVPATSCAFSFPPLPPIACSVWAVQFYVEGFIYHGSVPICVIAEKLVDNKDYSMWFACQWKATMDD